MIDFPTLYPSLVKYLPNWSERFYPSLAQFARGEGYPCGNQGVFIPRRNKCWTHPKTGQRLKKPLTYQMYKDAKEKSQRSRTEKGRTALETREQGFRDKAREKVKGWQKNKPQGQVTQEEVKPTSSNSRESEKVIADIEKVKSGQILLNEKERYRLQYDGKGMFRLNDPKLSARQGGTSKKLTEKEATDFLSEQYEKGETRYTPNREELGGVGAKLFIDSNTPEGKALLESEESLKKIKKTSSDHYVAAHDKNVAIVDYISKRSVNSPTKEQQEYDNKQPDKIELEKGAGLSEGWRSENAKKLYLRKGDVTASNDVSGIPWKVTSSFNGKEFVIVGAKVSDSYDGEKRQLTLHTSENSMLFSPFSKNDKEKENRAKRLVKEIAQGKSRNVNLDEINSMIDSGKSSKQTPNSTGGKSAGGKSETKIGKWNNKNFSPDDYIKEKDDLADGWFREGDKGAKEKYDQWVQNSMKKKVKLTVPGDVVATPDFMNMQRSGMINKNEIETKIRAGKELETLRTTYTFPSSFSHALQLYESQKPGVRKKIKFEFDGDLPDVPSRKKDFNASLKLANFAKPGCCCEASKPLRRRKTKQTPRLKRRGNRYA